HADAPALSLLPAGRIVHAGNGPNVGSGGEEWVVRLTSHGMLDPSFGSYGQVKGTSGWDILHIHTMARGVLLAVGSHSLERYTAAGVPDRSFGPGGVRRLSTPHDTFDATVDAAGRILVLATSMSSPTKVEVKRFLPSGRPDAGFGAHGVALPRGLPHAEPIALATQRDGSVIVLGATTSKPKPSLLLARLTPTGKLDSSFGRGGIVRPPIPSRRVSLSVAVAPDGQVALAAGENFLDPSRHARLLLVRYTSTGRLDRSFGAGGVASSDASTIEHRGRVVPLLPHAIAFDAAGDTIVAGANTYGRIDRGTEVPWFLARYTTHGLDCSFGTNGIVIGNEPGSADAIAVQRNGRIVIAGHRGEALIAARYLGGGKPRTCPGEDRTTRMREG
ncbi:MAG TPA: hypothetical protein VES65_00270, partial [Solirubrobacteraceae bacterium]|nr:hypothetical protein [Solirubrobacteraceae bacterium]